MIEDTLLPPPSQLSTLIVSLRCWCCLRRCDELRGQLPPLRQLSGRQELLPETGQTRLWRERGDDRTPGCHHHQLPGLHWPGPPLHQCLRALVSSPACPDSRLTTHICSVLCGDLTYVLLFPQLLLVLYLPQANTYGSASSFLVSLTLRLLTGDKYLGLTQHFSFGVITAPCPTLHHPALVCSGELPYRTIIMIIGLLVHISLSCLTNFLFCAAHVPLNLDVLGCFQKVDEEGNVVARKTRYLDGPVENLKVRSRKL